MYIAKLDYTQTHWINRMQTLASFLRKGE